MNRPSSARCHGAVFVGDNLPGSLMWRLSKIFSDGSQDHTTNERRFMRIREGTNPPVKKITIAVIQCFTMSANEIFQHATTTTLIPRDVITREWL